GEALVEVEPSAPSAGSKSTARNMFGASLHWIWDNYRARASYNRASWNLNFGDSVRLGERRFELLTYGVSGNWSGFSLMAEYAQTKDLDEAKYQRLAEEKIIAAVLANNAGDTAAAQQLLREGIVYSFKLGGSKAYYLTAGQQFSFFSIYLTYATLLKRP